MIFFVLGFIFPHLLGQRTFQVTFLNVTKYTHNPFRPNKVILSLLTVFIIILPIIFIMNVNINYSMEGTMFYEDLGTLYGGKFIEENAGDVETEFLVTDRNYYPVDIPFNINSTFIYENNAPQFFLDDNNTLEDIDIILYTPKLENRLSYFGFRNMINETEFSVVYDQGDAVILSH